ncbi:MAG TPA: hypothetical protein VGD99_12910, partial [Anaerolineae bacterium]
MRSGEIEDPQPIIDPAVPHLILKNSLISRGSIMTPGNPVCSYGFSRLFLPSLFGLSITFLMALSAANVRAQENSEPALQFRASISPAEVSPGMDIDLIIVVTNTGNILVEEYTVHLYLTAGFSLNASQNENRDIYTPVLTQTLAVAPGASTNIIVPLHVSVNSAPSEVIALLKAVEEGDQLGEGLVWLEIPIDGVNIAAQDISAQGDYTMPTAPTVSGCEDEKPLSHVGNAVEDAISAAAHYSRKHTKCNVFQDDWILDVPNVISSTTTTPTSAEDFYQLTAKLIENTRFTFSMSTLFFETHDETGNENLIRHYLAPAILKLHNDTPLDSPRPLLRFAYPPPVSILLIKPDLLQEVYDDLTADLREIEPDSKKWRVSIAVAGIGQFPTSPWNHSKIAVSDYEDAIVGGMNWNLNYIQPVDIDDDGVHEPTIEIDGHELNVHRLFDLSVKVAGEAARDAGVFFDLLWRRNIGSFPLKPHEIYNCISSWDLSLHPNWAHDCQLEAVPPYAPQQTSNQPGIIPDYEIDVQYNVFSLGRGHTDYWLDGVGNDFVEFSADDAILAALNAAQEHIYI